MRDMRGRETCPRSFCKQSPFHEVFTRRQLAQPPIRDVSGTRINRLVPTVGHQLGLDGSFY